MIMGRNPVSTDKTDKPADEAKHPSHAEHPHADHDEDHYSGDFCSLEEETSTEDDEPLE